MPVVTKPTKFSQGIVVSGGKTDTTWMVFDSDLLELDGKKFVQLTPSIRALTRLLCGDGDEKEVMENALSMLKTKRTESTIQATVSGVNPENNPFLRRRDDPNAHGWKWANTQKIKKVKQMAQLGVAPSTIELQLAATGGFPGGHTMVVCAGVDMRNNMYIEFVIENFDYIAQMCRDLILADHEDKIEWMDKTASWRATHLKDVLLCQARTHVILWLRCYSTFFDVFACLCRWHSCSLPFVYLCIHRSVANRGLF